MPDASQTPCLRTIATVVDDCLQRLRILSLDLDTYGSEDNATALREIIADLEKASQARPAKTVADFAVQGVFKVRRAQVANLLCCAFDEGRRSRFKIAEFVRPPTFGFRAHPVLVLRHLDYPLNEGGSLGIRSNESGSALFRLDLESISSGLNAMAVECPRHFVDFLNEKADAITGDAFLQCCLFGELIY
jgi:hypothetical protein